MLVSKEEGKSKFPSRGLCLFDLETSQAEGIIILGYLGLKRNNCRKAHESTKQNPQDRILGLHLLFHQKHRTSLKKHLSYVHFGHKLKLQCEFIKGKCSNYRNVVIAEKKV